MEWKECLHRTGYEDVILVSEFSAKNEVDVNEISIRTANLVTECAVRFRKSSEDVNILLPIICGEHSSWKLNLPLRCLLGTCKRDFVENLSVITGP